MHLIGLGTVEYKHHHGHETGSDWAAKYDLVKVGGQVKFKHVQIIVVSILFWAFVVLDWLPPRRAGRCADRGGGVRILRLLCKGRDWWARRMGIREWEDVVGFKRWML
jgi:hypothetical protein